ncbi:MAG: 4-hydroxy-3-methylbut-2-enyl diphosphate reductase [Actinobacteria bacterium]|nr:4-hydroxy-3-methylbut-2-enyl diphosphate reductase [Actinomycetota bacterium]
MKIEIAKYAGYCYGVERALKLATQTTNQFPKPIYTLGPIIHNPQVVSSLKEKGIYPINSIDDISEGTIIIRSHGIDPKIIAKAREKKIKVVDATCPFVKKAQQCASKLVEEKYDLIIVGERNHPEITGILAYADNKALVVEKPEDIPDNIKSKSIGVVVQTTQPIENLNRIVLKLLPITTELKIFNTICNATTKRQMAARRLALKTDVVLVVGGKNSANTTRLAQICKETGTTTHHIETAEEIDQLWFKKDNKVGVTAGASTPSWILDEVLEKIAQLVT